MFCLFVDYVKDDNLRTAKKTIEYKIFEQTNN